ncbi:hypothetical protein DY000_02061872 [Brassica cretica]|uniref:DUF223 domain-containing protein n=1 Tax=Brassica cretica TaxID=69181 RepID=A0ABQ7ARU9_BRACR|nr:hypothetical protein DY000_02061872 [Brassica cretica]
MASSLLGFPELQERQGVYSVIHGFTPVGRANHYMPSLKASFIVKVDRFEVSRCSSMYKITDHPFLIRFISLTIIDEVITGALEINLQSRLDYVVGQIRSVQGSGLTKETTRVVIRLLIDPKLLTALRRLSDEIPTDVKQSVGIPSVFSNLKRLYNGHIYLSATVTWFVGNSSENSDGIPTTTLFLGMSSEVRRYIPTNF